MSFEVWYSFLSTVPSHLLQLLYVFKHLAKTSHLIITIPATLSQGASMLVWKARSDWWTTRSWWKTCLVSARFLWCQALCAGAPWDSRKILRGENSTWKDNILKEMVRFHSIFSGGMAQFKGVQIYRSSECIATWLEKVAVVLSLKLCPCTTKNPSWGLKMWLYYFVRVTSLLRLMVVVKVDCCC